MPVQASLVSAKQATDMLHRFTTVAILLGLIIQHIDGFDRVIVVSESDVHVISYDETSAIGSGSGSYVFDNSCCIYGNCSCPSLYNALANLTSNALINITTDVVLSSIIPLVDLANIAITGHNNPTVNCNDSGGLNFISCCNCTIEGITWNGCGARNISNNDNVYPVLQLFNSSNITIRSCLFQHSIGQAVVLSEMIGDVKIDHCSFSSNKQYEGHGTAIHYSSNNMSTGSAVEFMITDCNFLHNENAKSVAYFDQSSATKLCENLNLQNSIFHGNKGVPVYLSNKNLHIHGNIEFYNNIAENGGGIFISNHSKVTFHKSATVNFTHNTANNNGGAIFLTNHSNVVFEEHPTTVYQCHDNTLYDTLSDQYLAKSLTVTFYSNTANGFGQVIYAHNSNITVGGNANVTFNDNRRAICTNNAVYVNYHCTVTFEGNSKATFDCYGEMMYIDVHSTITFQENSTAIFLNSYRCNCYYYGINGGIYIMNISDNSIITFQGNSTVTFGASNGVVMYISDNSIITFQGNSTVTFGANNNGVMYISDNSIITFQGNSTVTFGYNYEVMYISDNCNIIFQGNSTVTFVDNYGGIMYINDNCIITFQGNSTVTFTGNDDAIYGEVMYISHNSIITFQGNSTVTFGDNRHIYGNGGVMYIRDNSNIIFQGNSTVTFTGNDAINGGVMYISHSSTITFQGNSTVTFGDNHAGGNGGVMYISYNSIITFQGNSTVTFYNSQEVNLGGTMFIYYNSAITFKENSKLTFNNNAANLGGVMYIDKSSTIGFEGNSIITFTNNQANGEGGAIYIIGYSTIAFKGNSEISFCKNKADDKGGSLYVDNSSSVEFKENSKLLFNGNTANSGGSIFSKTSSIIIDGNSFVKFIYNTALRDGGAIYLSDYSNFTQLNYSNVTFYYNSARDYGGAVYVLLKGSSINFNSSGIYFMDNTARTIQISVYINVQKAYENDSLILNRSVNIGNNIDIPLTTSPNKLVLYDPAKCIKNDDTDCDTYYMNNIMLGQEITFDACLLDYYDQPTETIQFSITGMNHQDYTILGQKYISISCNHTTQGISVIGNLQSNKSYNYSVNISLYVTHASEFKFISVNLIIELSQCQLGFWYSNESQQCECYNADDIISCSGSNSTIKRGYWFGNVTGKPTVTSCPNDYCNFTCCEITNGIYHLSPVRANQCGPHRSGTACGNCEKGYTLSFDSPECVEVNKCTIGTALISNYTITVILDSCSGSGIRNDIL